MIQREEYTLFFLLSLMLLLLATSYDTAWITVHSVLSKRYGVEYMPLTYIGFCLFTSIGTFSYFQFIKIFSKKEIIFKFFTAFTLIICIFTFMSYAYFEKNIWFLLILILLIQSLCGSILPTQVWNVITDIFRADQQRRLNPLFLTAWMFGEVSAGLFSAYSFSLGASSLLLTCLIVTVAILAFIIFNLIQLPERWHKISIGEEDYQQQSLKVIYNFIKKSTLIKIICTLPFFCWMLFTFQDYQYTQIMNNTFPNENELGQWLGKYMLVSVIIIMITQVFFATDVLLRLGIFKSILMLPACLSLIFFILIFNFNFYIGVLLKFTFDFIGWIFFSNTLQLLFNSIPLKFRASIRALADGIFEPVGVWIGSIIILSVSYIILYIQGFWNGIIVGALACCICLIWIGVVLIGKKNYVQDLLGRIHETDKLSAIDIIEILKERGNALTVRALNMMLANEKRYDTAIRTKVIDVLSWLHDPESLRALSLCLLSDKSSIRFHALCALCRYRQLDRMPLAKHHLINKAKSIFFKDPDTHVRYAASYFLLQVLSSDRISEFITSVLSESDSKGKIELIKIFEKNFSGFSDLIFITMLDEKDPQVYSEIITALWPLPIYHEILKDKIISMITSNDQQKVYYGIITLIKLDLRINELDRRICEVQQSLEIHIKCLANLLGLLYEEEKNTKPYVDAIIEILLNEKYTSRDRIELIQYLSKLKSEKLDLISERLLQLSEEEKQVATKHFDLIGKLINEADELDELLDINIIKSPL